jgi:hypothetical protein
MVNSPKQIVAAVALRDAADPENQTIRFLVMIIQN